MDSWILKTPIAHRGLHNDKSPENSLSSFDNAIKKSHAIELDIRFTSDNEIIVFHDKTTKRICGDDLVINETPLKKLTTLKLLDSSESIPTLKETLDRINGKVPLLIEIKNEYEVGPFEEKLAKLLKSYPHEFAIQSFNPWSLKKVKELDPTIKVGLLSGSFKKSSLGHVSKFVLRNLLLTPYVQPDFLSVEYDAYNGLQKSVAGLYDSKRVIFWTIRNKEKAKVLQRLNKNFIYEGFEI
jgi:glycerophosphoryl diester phosphodiesterase